MYAHRAGIGGQVRITEGANLAPLVKHPCHVGMHGGLTRVPRHVDRILSLNQCHCLTVCAVVAACHPRSYTAWQ